MILVIETQCYENYGSQTEPYWKAKGGNSYKVTGIPERADLDEIVSILAPEIEKKNPFYEQTIIGYGTESDGWLSQFERSQIEYDGSVEFGEPVIEYSEVVERYA